MLENCVGLEDCERVLAGAVERAAFLGQVELPAEDVEKLATLIGERIGRDVRLGTLHLQEYAPTCLAMFLVGLGIWKYTDGTYWPAVAETVGLNDVNWQVRWGRFFLEFLERKGLPQFDLEQEGEGSRRYVTPILLHGGIPQHCLEEFFNRIVLGLIGDDVVTEDDLKDRLYSIREQELRKRELQKDVERLEKEKEKLSEEHGRLVRLESLQKKAEELAAVVSSPEQWSDLPEDCSGFLLAKESELKEVRRQIAALEKQREIYCRKIRAFTKEDWFVLEWALAIEQCARECQDILYSRERLREQAAEEESCREKLNALMASLWQSPWDERYEEPLRNLSWELLAEKCREYRVLRDYHRGLSEELARRKVCTPHLHPGFWLGVFFIPAGIGLLFLLLGWTGALLISAGLAVMAGTYSRLCKEKRLEVSQKQEYEDLQYRISAAEEKLHLLEGEIDQLAAGLPLPADGSWALDPDAADALRSLKEVWGRRWDCVWEMRQIESRLAEWDQRVRDVAAGAVGVSPDSGEGVLEMLLDRLSESRKRRAEAEQAEKVLREEIEPRLQELKKIEARLEGDRCRVTARLMYWGRGNPEEGMRELALKRDVFRRLKELNAEVEKLAGLLGIPQEALVGGKLGELREAKAADLESLCGLLKDKERDLARCPSLLPAVDRPVERFLLYGGEWAERWLLGAVRLAERTFRERRLPEEIRTDLPARVIVGFKEWWEKYCPSDPSRDVLPEPERFSDPVLKLDPRRGGLLIYIGRCRFRPEDPGTAPKVILKISACGLIADDKFYTAELPLQVYRGREGCAETEVSECPVSPAGSYEVSLVVDGKARKYRQIAGIGEGQPFLAFDEDGSQFTGDILPRRKLWLFFLSGYSLLSDVPVIEDATPSWPPPGYRLFLIDLSSVKDFYLTDSLGVQYRFPLANAESFEPYLSDGQTVDFTSVDGSPVYTGEPPSLVIPTDKAGWEGWSIVVRRGMGLSAERRRFLLRELPEGSIRYCEGRAEIFLGIPELLGPEPAGMFTVRLRSAKRSEYVFRLAVVPDLLVIFEPQLLLPFTGEDDLAYLTVIVPENAALAVSPPAEITALEDEAYEIAVPRREEAVRASLVLARSSEKTVLPLTIGIPGVRWRLQGLEGQEFSAWQNRVEEVLLGDRREAGDALFLEIELPVGVGESVQLYLNDSLHHVTKSIEKGYARFSLLDFTDTLRAGKEAIRVFSIKVYGQRQKLICEGPLFRVRCRWTVEGMQYSVQNLPGTRRLRIEWSEKGREQNRVLRLWRLWEPWLPPLVEPIPDGAVELIIEREKAILPSGRYLVQFDVEEPWFPGAAVSFPAERFNTTEIEIGGGEPYVKDLEARVSEETEITGTLVNATPGEKIAGLLCGMAGGRPEIYWVEDVTGPEGRFCLRFPGSDKVQPLLPAVEHWFVWYTPDFSSYECVILPDPAPLEFDLSKLAAEEIAKIIEMQKEVRLGVRLACRKGHLEHAVLSSDDTVGVLQAWAEGCNSIDFSLMIDRKLERVKIERSEGENLLRLESGVMCIGCGAILPNQQAWYSHSSNRLTDHYGMRINYVDIPVVVNLIWDIRPVIRKCREKYPTGWRELLVLYSSSRMPLPPWGDKGGVLDVEQLAGVLWEREKERAYALARRLEKVGH